MSSSSNKKRKDRNAELETELLRLAAENDLDETLASIRELIEVSRVNVNCTDEKGWTPLMIAILFGHVQIGRYLIGKKANLDAVDNEGCTVLGHAVTHPNPNIALIQHLLEAGADKDQHFQVNGRAISLLGYAIFWRSAEMVALLLQFRANTVETLCCGKTLPALHHACHWPDVSVDIVRLLLDHEDGVNVNTPVRWSGALMTPLCSACMENNMEKARLLVGAGAQVIFPGHYPGVPFPLAVAVIYGSMELIRFLLGKLPQGDNLAVLSKPLQTALYSNKLEVAQLLVDHGANVNGHPYLYMCAELWHDLEGVENRVSFLLEKGADLNMTTFGGETPLFAAARNGSFELVKLFVNAKADVNIRSNLGETPLEAAYRGGHKGIVSLLLRTSPDVWPRLQNVL